MSGEELIGREDSLLVVVDMQERLVPAMAEPGKIVENTKRLLGLARVLDLPVIVTEQEKLGATISEVGEKLATLPIPKVAFDCFSSEEFSERVRQTGRKNLVIAGIEAHICITQTALSAKTRFNVHVVSDAIGSRSHHNVTVAVERMRAAGVTITSTEMVIYELLRRAGTAEFKAVLPLVK